MAELTRKSLMYSVVVIRSSGIVDDSSFCRPTFETGDLLLE